MLGRVRADFNTGRMGVSAQAISLLASVVTAAAVPPFATEPRSSPATGGLQAEIFGLRVGCHKTFDRFVVRTRFAGPGYDVRYARQVVYGGSGRPVSLLGDARIQVVLRPARGHTMRGASLLPGVVTPLCPTLRQVRIAEDFEGVVSFGLGVRHKQGFRVFRLPAPNRVVIDVAH